ncbi:MAG TPA: hypothetical protein VFR35_12225, partial [Actinoplanes sp.]|nr:hypothetical protein [Actinoplanes sp.]
RGRATAAGRGRATAAGRAQASATGRAQVTAAGRAPAARLRRAVGIEVAATTVILAFSAVLVQVTPGRSAEGERTAPVRDGFSQTLTSKYYTLQFTIYPVELGEWNTVHGLTYTPEGKQLRAPEWTITTRHLGTDRPGAGPEPVSEPMLPVPGRNDALGSVTFPLAGAYEISFTIRTGDVDRATVRTRVTVPAVRSR